MIRQLFLGALLCSGVGTAALAQTSYPERPVTIVAPFAPGGNTDFVIRSVSELLAKSLGKPVIVENRAGAGGVIGTAYVAHAKPDGYTLLLASTGTNAMANAVSKRIAYDGVKSFTVLGGLTTNPAVLTISTQNPANDFAGFKAYAQHKEGGVSLGTAGVGSFTHLAAEMLRTAGGLPMTPVAYKGTGPAATDLMGHTIDGMVDQITTALPLIREGRVKAIAQLGQTRSPLLPDVPTIAEQGVNGAEATLYTGVFGPAGLDPAVAAKLSAALQEALRDPALQKRYRDMGAEPWMQDQAAFQRHVDAEAAHWVEAARKSNVSIDD
ncbi:hypothetical protein JL37_08070 [Achromobacter sp. RTa]|uniref:Bug family tripartite tricarboxylate transporter substrate binding protein n=1 Tax=Achromobacter sp. RTa TaxID=1532557 RepID=UPI00050F1911|nr:tripartite tricarboxylate transporter substrate binding protein [Achromobacter sp. RTa]KGD96794.1 hypothetical protein JL37_08070 [Achromobacter sp. RTa]